MFATQEILPQTPAPRPGREILLQAFHWDSHRGCLENGQHRSWYQIVRENLTSIHQAGFTWVWLPPPSDSLAPEGYIPRRWNVLHSAYGSETELRALIQELAPVKAMADVVLNHRVGVHTPGADFADPPFPDNHTAIACDDESGVGKGQPDTGERHPAGRDLDHTNPGVRSTIKDYLRRLRMVGFQGWRYDLVKGFAGRFVGEYNEASEPLFSVGEYFDTDRQKMVDWIDQTGGRSAAFDFSTRFLLHDACSRDDYSALRTSVHGRDLPGGLIGFWPERAVTFVDNHDTEWRRDREHQSSCNATRAFHGKTVQMAYAYILTHPGHPCVFWAHYFDWGQQTRQVLDQLLHLRRSLDLHACSQLQICEARQGLYAAILDGKVAVKLGSQDWAPDPSWDLRIWGDHFAVWCR